MLFLLKKCIFFMSFVIIVLLLANYSSADMIGTYLVSEYNPNSGIPEAVLYEMTFDGNGNFMADVLYDTNGNNITGITGVYSVDSDGMVAFDAGLEHKGIVNSDGSIFTIAQTGEPHDTDAGMLVGIKKSSGLSNASISGTYLVSEYNPNSGIPEASLYEMIFDGNGNFIADVLYETHGNIITGITGTYSVAPDGMLTFDAGLEDKGIVSSDGSIFTIAQTGEPQDTDAGILVGIIKSSGLSNDSISGTYLVSEYNPNSGIPEAALYEMTFDGNGNFIADVLYETHGNIITGITGTYSVAPDGMLTFNAGLEDKGIVNSDGSIFTIAQTGEPQDTDAGILVGIKSMRIKCAHDIDEDGDVDGRDLSILVSNPSAISFGFFTMEFGSINCQY